MAALNRVERYNLGRIEAKTGCFKPNERELSGPTDVNARPANGRLAIGLNRDGTVTIFRCRRRRPLDRPEDAARYRARQHELGRAIDRELYDATEGAYSTKRAGVAS